MHANAIKTAILSLAACAVTATVAAEPIPEPDVVLYGGILLGGVPVGPAQTDVVVTAVPEGDDPALDPVLATYTIGDNPDALIDADDDGQVNDAGYLLRLRMEYLPMGAVQSAGAVIIGDVVDLYVEDPPTAPQLMGSYTVSGRGTVTRLDLPPTGGTCTGDTDGSGTVDVVDFLDLLAGWGPNPGHPADFNDDGTVDVIDFLALLAAWGPCP